MKRANRVRATVVFLVVVLFVVVGAGRRAEAGPTVATLNCDTDGNTVRDTADAVRLLGWLFLDGPAPVELRVDGEPVKLQNGDSNGDDVRDVADCLHLLFFLFASGEEPVAPAPPTPTTYAGALPASRGRWSYGGTIGLEGAISICNENFPASTVCNREQLIAAAAAGELVEAVDIDGDPVGSFWIHDPDAPPDRQCIHTGAENITWSYSTGHLPSHGEYVDIDGGTGALSETQLQNHCAGAHWVPCCNSP